jgi:guanylate kinase
VEKFLNEKTYRKGLNPCLKWTTRPMRKYEEQGVDYNFVKSIEFSESINEE